MTLFVLSERAVAASKPKKTTEIKNEPEELSFNSMPEQLLHLENLNGKSEVYIIKNLLSSDELVPFEIEKNSTWASSPKTIKAFTAYKIAVLISGDHFFQEKIQEFKNHKIHDLLIDMLNSADIGDVENSLLAIVYICEKCKKMQKAFFESHLFDHLKKKILTAYLLSRPNAPAGGNKNKQMHTGRIRHHKVLGFFPIYESSERVSPAVQTKQKILKRELTQSWQTR